MPRKPRQTITLTPDEVAHLCEAFASMERVEQGMARLWVQLRGRAAEIARAQAMVRACLDGTPLSVQYAAILTLAEHCVTQMQRNPDACPED